jgi:hypothetical protein
MTILTRIASVVFALLLTSHGCSDPQPPPLKFKATGTAPQVLALYEAWFGFSQHINVGYSTQDPAVLHRQIRKAKTMGISAFVVDWYGDREPFIDKSYAMLQAAAQSEKFQVAMMYDETDQDDGATDEAFADFTMFHDTYLTKALRGPAGHFHFP